MTSRRTSRPPVEPPGLIPGRSRRPRRRPAPAGAIHQPLLPLQEPPVFPHMVAPLIVARERSLAAVDAAVGGNGLVVLVSQRDPKEEAPDAGGFYTVGTLARIVRRVPMPDGTLSVIVQGKQRVHLAVVVDSGSYWSAAVSPLEDEGDFTPALETLMGAVLTTFERCVDLSPDLSDEDYVAALDADRPGWLADLILSMLPLDLTTGQDLLETLDPAERLQRVSVLLARELSMLELEDSIHAQVQEEVDRSQREYLLREQMRVIQAELGEMDELASEVAAYQARIEAAAMPPKAQEKAEQELRRLAAMPPFAPELTMARAYLDWLVELPWSATTEDNMDLAHAARVLAENHYGVPKAKDRILEHIAVRTLAEEKMSSPILCLVGPPGTGKTSMGRSVAQALGRKFVRISLGGVRDEAEIRGHRRTYIGALPGRIIHTMRAAGTANPVFMIDEIDKLGQDFRGDPASALLEVLDPEQNVEFTDHYLDVPYDLSKVLFITTANLLDPIPEPLLDRMEVISFPGYIEEEKLRIAEDFLIPRQVEQTGLTGHGLHFTEGTLRLIIREYTYEAGLRNLERSIASICRKVARRVAEGKQAPHRITPAQVAKFLGPPEYVPSMAEEQDEIGVATGVAWTEAGGDLVQVEVTLMPGKGNLTLTGQLGEVMQESAQAALSYARSHAGELGINPVDFDELDVHIHLPEGATPKDGPSAGITMATALISALTERPVRRDVAMTGEITLRGRVLPVGGLKEKALAAHRAGLKMMVIPARNQKDLVEMPARIRREVQIVAVSTMAEVLEHALLAPPPDARTSRVAARRSKPKSPDSTSRDEV